MVTGHGETVRLVSLIGFSGNSGFMPLLLIYFVSAAESMLRWGCHLHPEVSVETVSRSLVSMRLNTAGTQRQDRSSEGAMDWAITTRTS